MGLGSSFGRNSLANTFGRHTSVTERFQKAAAASDLIAEPGTTQGSSGAEHSEEQEPGTCDEPDMQHTGSDSSTHERDEEGGASHSEDAELVDSWQALPPAAAADEADGGVCEASDGSEEGPATVEVAVIGEVAAAAAETRESARTASAAGDDVGGGHVVDPSAAEGAGTMDRNSPGFVKAVVAEVRN